MIKPLKEIALLQFGYYAKPAEKGEAIYLQAGDFNNTGISQIEINARLRLDKQAERHLLMEGDILFAGKGFRNFAWTYTERLGPAIASSLFFVIRPDKNRVVPEYLTTLLNTNKYQSYFQKLGAGSSIPSIRKNELEDIEIQLPPFSTQRKIVELGRLHHEYISLAKQIITKRNQLYESVIHKMINT